MRGLTLVLSLDLLLLLLVVPGCGAVQRSEPDGGVVDALDPADTGPAPRCDPRGTFDPPVPLAGLADPAEGEGTIRLSTDERTAYVSGLFGGASAWDIMVAERASVDAPFGPLVPFSQNGDRDDWDPTISADGLVLVFGSTRLAGDSDLFLTTRASTDAEFGAPVRIPELNSPVAFTRDGQAFLTADGEEIWFHSDRAGGDGGPDLYRATRSGTTFGTPVRVAELSSPSEEWLPVLSADRRTIYFSSDRLGDYDIWVAHRDHPDEPFATPSRVTELASAGSDHPGSLSADGCRLYLNSTRAGGSDAYVAVRRPQ
jgi:Tol biopolymer transport system component